MDEVTKTRIKVLSGLAIIVVIVHVILIKVFVFSGTTGAAGDKRSGEQPKNKGNEPQVKRVVYRNFVPSRNPRFGQPLNYTGTIRGNLPATAVAGSSGARSGIIVDMESRRVLWEKNSTRPVPIASMAKMMTMLLVMEQLERRHDLTVDTPVAVTKTARDVPRTGVLYLAPGESFTIQELMIATAVKSANDASTLLAEYFGGSVPVFVNMMNSRALQLGLRNTSFINPCGLPEGKRNSLGSAVDMVMLGEQLLQYPLLMEWCNLKSASIRSGKTVFVNTNKLVNPRYPGVDGLKTGYIRAAGSCLTFSAVRNKRRIMGCVTGFKSSRERDRFCRRLLDWAYKQPGTVTAKR